MSASYSCPNCGGHLKTKVQRLMFHCRRCEEVIVEIAGDRRVVA